MAAATVNSPLSQTLQLTLDRLRQLNTKDIQSHWQYHSGDSSDEEIFEPELHQQQNWQKATLNDRQHISWKKGLQVLWLYQEIVVPHNFMGYPLTGLTLRLALTWWADDAQIYVDGQLVQSGDLFECFTRTCLSSHVTTDQTFKVSIRLVSPAHDDGALVRSQLIYELPANHPTPEPSFVADELNVLAILEPQAQAEIEAATAKLQWDSLNTDSTQPFTNDALNIWQDLSALTASIPAITHPFQQSLSQLRRDLKHYSTQLKSREIQCVGHAHLDMAWLWPISDTWKVAERTFRSILSLQKDFPELTYTHSSPALFEWIENNRPELFEQIRQKVKEGSWSIDAGLWIEPELNIIGGEAIVRQILYGQRYCQEKFGTLSKVAWLPDSFGFCWQLPQLLLQGGIETFATLKLSWNDTTEFPYALFWWQSPDGSRIRSIMLPPIGTDIDPVKMAEHNAHWKEKTQSSKSMWLPGLGDHGGGPTKDMLEKSRRWEKSPFFPNLKFTKPNQYLQDISSVFPQQPTWNDELYLELHRGCYTAHADQKQNNRQCEDLLYQAELFASISYLTVNQPYPKVDLETAWKALLFNQFHDILPGTSVPEVFSEAAEIWQQVKQNGQTILRNSLDAITSAIELPQSPHPEAELIVVFNPLNWRRNEVIEIKLPKTYESWEIRTIEQQPVQHQLITEATSSDHTQHLLFIASDIPSIGYRSWWLCPSDSNYSHTQNTVKEKPLEYCLENQYVRAVISTESGQILSLIEKSTQQEIVHETSNQLQIFQDESGYWDAWNIAQDYADHPCQAPALQSIQIIESGPVRQRLRTRYQFNQSVIIQDYVLEINSRTLTVENTIDWQETHKLLKVNFPVNLFAREATYEIPFGAITRTTQPKTKAEEAKWEVPALRWSDISDAQHGLSILTKGKHGFDAGPNHLRLTLLKSPTWPDPTSDKGLHRFTYSLYPHTDSWQSAHTVKLSHELNISSLIHRAENTIATSSTASTCLPTQHSFIDIQSSNIILSALKMSEDNNDHFILRCYEAYGEPAKVQEIQVKNANNLNNTVSILEQSINLDQPSTIKPWQIVSYRLQKINSYNQKA